MKPFLLAALAASLFAASGSPQPFNTREVIDCALAAILSGGDVPAQEAKISSVFETQIMRTGDPSYGEIPIYSNAAAIEDPNQTVFVAQAAGPLFAGHRSQLSPAFFAEMKPHVRALMEALDKRNVSIDYTNIYLGKNVSLLLLGSAFGDTATVERGRAALHAWMEHTRTYGIHEFDSPAYYATDLDSLSAGYRYAPTAGDREFFRGLLNDFWKDIAQQFFDGSTKLIGPHSRTYDYIRNLGGVDNWLDAAGWAKARPPTNPTMVFVDDNMRAGGYRPPERIVALAHSGPRESTLRWDEDPNHVRRIAILRNVAMGCATGEYGPQDDPLTVAFQGDRRLAEIGIFTHSGEDPYGPHLPSGIACVEAHGIALITMDIDAAPLDAAARGLTTSILLPQDADISAPSSPSGILSAALSGGSFALRFISVDSANGRTPAVAMVADPQVRRYHVLRFVITHLPPGERTTQHHLRMVFLAAIADSSRENAAGLVRDALVDRHTTGDEWIVSATAGRTHLEIVRSLTQISQIYSQRASGG
jgi:hypothetical protein